MASPGPWDLEKIDDAEKTLVYYRVNSGKNTIGFAGVYHNRKLTDEECTANAHLVAAAPEMIEALFEAKRMYEELEPAGGWQGVYEQIEDAIKKATKI